jgi:hypothetical protein
MFRRFFIFLKRILIALLIILAFGASAHFAFSKKILQVPGNDTLQIPQEASENIHASEIYMTEVMRKGESDIRALASGAADSTRLFLKNQAGKGLEKLEKAAGLSHGSAPPLEQGQTLSGQEQTIPPSEATGPISGAEFAVSIKLEKRTPYSFSLRGVSGTPFEVDWGDGSKENGILHDSLTITHAWKSSGKFTIVFSPHGSAKQELIIYVE